MNEQRERVPEFFHPYIDATFELEVFVDLGWAGLDYARNATRVIELIRGGTGSGGSPHPLMDDKIYEDRLKKAKKMETFATEQVRHGFPYLYNIAIVRLWTILETAVDDLILHLLTHDPTRWETPAVKRLKGPLIEFIHSSATERAAFLADLLMQEVNAKHQPGVGRFEAVINAVDFGGPVDEAVRRKLLELSEIRNVVVHRNGKADSKLIERCPWLSLSVGDAVRVTPTRFHHYVNGTLWYFLELSRRWILYYSVERAHREHDASEIGEVQEEIAQGLAQIQ